jgi:hypothetical protein
MKRVLALPAVVLLLGSVACSSPEVVAEAAITQQSTGERLALQDLPIRLLPYDRDAIFDSLQAAHPTPEPPIPPDLLQQRQAVVAAQEAHAQAEARWGTLRDSLRTLSDRTTQLQRQGLRGTPQYRVAFEAFDRLAAEEERVKQTMDQAFARFTTLQEASIARADSVRVAREAWADEAFRDFQTIVDARLETMGLEEFADTTGAAGTAVFRVPEGQWWVYGRYTLPYEELYWNEPIEVSGDSTHIQLSEENADRRPVL